MQAASAEPVADRAGAFARDIQAQIVNRLGRRIRQLQVVVQEGGGLILRGRVSTYYAKQLAQQAVMEMGGLILLNDIEVC